MIEIIIGTSRPGANSRKVGNEVFKMYKNLGIEAGLIDLKDVSVSAFSGDSINERPKAIEEYANRILKAKGVHFVTPEYNGSVPGVLKFFIDLLPFPEAFADRCFAITTVSQGPFGGIRASYHLEDIITYKGGYIFNQKVMVGNADDTFEEKGNFKDEKLKERLEKQVIGFEDFTKKIKKAVS